MKAFYLFFFISGNLLCQSLDWSSEISHNKVNYLGGVSCDELNNVYVAGRFDRGYHGTGRKGLFRCKYDSQGVLLWSDTTALSSSYRFSALSGLPNGDSYITATSNKNFTIGDSTVDLGSAFGYNNSFIVRQDNGGNIIWTRVLAKIISRSIKANENHLYLGGEAEYSTNIEGQSIGNGGCVIKFDHYGNCLKAINTGTGPVRFLDTDGLGNLYVQTGNATDHQEIRKYDQNDSLLWSYSVGYDVFVSMTVDSAGNVFFVHSPLGATYIRKLVPNGNEEWTAPCVGYHPAGSCLPDYEHNVLLAVSVRNDSLMGSYLCKYDLTNGALLSCEQIALPPHYDMYLDTRLIKDHSGNLVVAGDLCLDYVKVSVKKYSYAGTSSVLDVQKQNQLEIFPNPSSAVFHVRYTSSSSNLSTLSVLNVSGQTIWSRQIKHSGTISEVIDLSAKAKGIYTVEVLDGKKRSVKKVVIE